MMGVTRVTGTWFDTALGQNHVQLIASLPAGAWLHEADVQGMAMPTYTGVTEDDTHYPFYNIAAGIQYGAVGHNPTGITDGTGAGETWLTFANALPATFVVDLNNGAISNQVVQRVSYAIEAHWRGLIYFAAGADLHIEVGCNAGAPLTSTWRSFHTNSVVYST